MALNDYDITHTEKCLEKMREIEHVDEALAAVYDSLRKNPYAFGIVPPLAAMRFAKTVLYLGDGFTVPPLTIFFTVIEDGKIVKILDVLVRPGFGNLDSLDEE